MCLLINMVTELDTKVESIKLVLITLVVLIYFRSEEIEDAWMALFGHIARVMAHGHTFYYQKEVSTEK
jgi:hypothetical protein